MADILLLQGMGNNERGWARLLSAYGRTTLVQVSVLDHAEVWEDGRRVTSGPETDRAADRRRNDLEFGRPARIRAEAMVREFAGDRVQDLVIAANHDLGRLALRMRRQGRTLRAVLFLTDHFPPRGPPTVVLHRLAVAALTRQAARRADEVWAISPRIPAGRRHPRRFTVPLPIDDFGLPPSPRDRVAYIGFPSPDHGLDMLFRICGRRGWPVDVVGDSPYLATIRDAAPPGTVFHGVRNDPAEIAAILGRAFCGYAVYRTSGPRSYSHFGFPSKSLYFLAADVPVVITDAGHFNRRLAEAGVGRMVSPDEPAVEAAMADIRERPAAYQEAAAAFRRRQNAAAEAFHHDRLAALGIRSPGADAGGGAGHG